MSQVLTNALLLVHDADLSGQSNTMGLDLEVEAQDDTTLEDTTRSNAPGLKAAGFSAEGFFDSGVDAKLFANQGISNRLVTLCIGRTAGDVAYVMRAMQGSYSPVQGAVGEMHSFTLDGAAQNSIERGQLLIHSSALGSSGDGTAVQAGAAATQVIGALHVFSASGTSPTLDVVIESDNASGMSSPVGRLTFTQATGVTSERAVAVGAVADDWWRVSYTIGGTTPSFGFAVTLILE